MGTVVQALAQGLSLGAVLLLSALGLTIIYGVMRVVNLAHGEFVMLGAYVMVLFSTSLSAPLAIIIAPFIVGALGLLVDRLIVRRMYGDAITSMLGTFALGIVIRQLVLIGEGPQLQFVPVPLSGTMPIGFGESFALWRAALVAISLLAAGAVAIWLSRSRTGLEVRLATADPEIAQTLGTNVQRVSALAFGIGAALAGLAGALVAPLNSVHPTMGLPYLVGAFLIVILAGLGNVKKVVVYSIVVGIATAAIAIQLDDVLAQIIVWVVALLLVGLRRRSVTPVRV